MLRADVRRTLRRTVFGLREATGSVHATLFWRALYGLLERPAVVRLAARVCALAARDGRDPVAVADRALPLFETGWPHHPGTPWVNLHVQRFHRRVLARLEPGEPLPQRRPRPRPETLRIGVLGLLDKAFFFTRAFFEAKPANVQLVALDLGSSSPVAERYVLPHAESYSRFSLGEIDELAQATEAAGLDVLLADVRKREIYWLLDRITTPCVALLCSEVFLRHHPAVSFHLYPFEQADYFVRGDRIFCGTSASYLPGAVVYPCAFPYDLRGLDPERRRPWRERDPLVVFHGRLFKASESYVEVILGLLRDDPELEFVLMGTDSQGALERIRSAAARAGVESRVHYEGPFTTAHDDEGRLVDPAWERLFDLLGRARLAPDPWPFAGGASRIEAYASGAPAPHLGIRTDRASWGRPQPMLTFEHTAINVGRGTAYSLEAYRDLCRRSLRDEAFADTLAAEQAAVAAEVGDPSSFWRALLAHYDRWLATR